MTTNGSPERRPFRAADVLTGSIDRRRPSAEAARTRKQISAQLEPEQLRLLGEIHARLNASAARRIEKSDLVGLGIELLAAVLAETEAETDGGPAPAPDGRPVRRHGTPAIADAAGLRAHLRTHVRAYAKHGRG